MYYDYFHSDSVMSTWSIKVTCENNDYCLSTCVNSLSFSEIADNECTFGALVQCSKYMYISIWMYMNIVCTVIIGASLNMPHTSQVYKCSWLLAWMPLQRTVTIFSYLLDAIRACSGRWYSICNSCLLSSGGQLPCIYTTSYLEYIHALFWSRIVFCCQQIN